MNQEKDWLSEVFDEVSKEVQKWPEWKRNPEVRRRLRKLEEQKRAAQGAAAAPALKTQSG